MKKLFWFLLVISIIGFLTGSTFAEDMWILPDGTILTRSDVYEVPRETVDGIPYMEKYGRGDYDNPEKLAEIGAKSFVVIKDFDKTYYEEDGYVDSQDTDVVTRVYSKKPKMTLEKLKARKIRQAEMERDNALSATDRDVLKCLELSEAIPAAIVAERQAIRDAYNAEVTKINGYSDYTSAVQSKEAKE